MVAEQMRMRPILLYLPLFARRLLAIRMLLLLALLPFLDTRFFFSSYHAARC
jgi:hypothetical protein